MKDFKDFIKLIIIGSILAGNLFLIFYLLHNPYVFILQDKNQPYNIPEGNDWIKFTTLAIIGLLLITSAYLLILVYKRQKIPLISPLFTLSVILSLFLVSYNSLAYPSSTGQYSKDGYYYKMEIWWNTPNQIRTYKRWKSVLPYDGKANPDLIKYVLDSLSNTKDE